MEWSAEHGRALRERRQRQGFSQEQLAEQAGLAPGTVKNLERGATTPRPSTLQLMAEALGCTCHDLLEKRVHPPSAPRSVAPLDSHLPRSSPVAATDPEIEPEPGFVVLEGPREAPRRRRVQWLALGGVVVVVLAILGSVFQAKFRQSPVLDPGLVAVAVFENRSGDPSLDAIGRELAQRVVQGVAELDLASATATLAATHPTDSSDTEPNIARASAGVEALAAASHAGTVVTGAYAQEQGRLVISAGITNAQSGESIYTLPVVEGRADSPGKTVAVASDRIVGALAAHFDWFVPSPRLATPPTIEAYRAFRAGMDCWRDYKAGSGSDNLPAEILEHFHHAIELDSTFMAPRFEKAILLQVVLGDFVSTSTCLNEIASKRDRLGRWDNTRLDCHVAGLQGDRHAHLRGIRRLVELDPENQYLRYWLVISTALARRYQESLDASNRLTDAALREPLIGRNALLWQALSWHAVGEYEQELDTVRLLDTLYPGDWWALGRERIRVFVALDRIEDVHEAINNFMTIPQSPGSRGRVLGYAVEALRARGYHEDAARIANRAVAYYLEQPQGEASGATHRPALARSLYAAQRLAEAQALFEQLAAEHPANIDYKGRLGTIAARQDDREMAERIFEDLHGLHRPHLLGAHTVWCARIVAQLDEPERAVELLREALSQGSSLLELHPCIDLEPLYGYEPYEELWRPKG